MLLGVGKIHDIVWIGMGGRNFKISVSDDFKARFFIEINGPFISDPGEKPDAGLICFFGKVGNIFKKGQTQLKTIKLF